MSYTDIMKIVPTMSATALLADNVKYTHKNKYTTKSMINQGVKNIVGTNLITETAKLT